MMSAANLGRHLVNEFGHSDIQLRHPTSVMRGQGYLDTVVDVEPLGMVINLFGQ